MVVDRDVQAGAAEPRGEPQPRPSAWCPPSSGILATFLTSTWMSSPGLSRSWRTGVTGPRRRTSPVTRSTSASLGIPRLATILAQVWVGTPVAAASPGGASSSDERASQACLWQAKC